MGTAPSTRFKIQASIPRCQEPNQIVQVLAQAYRTNATFGVDCQALAPNASVQVLVPVKPLPGPPVINDTQCLAPLRAAQWGK